MSLYGLFIGLSFALGVFYFEKYNHTIFPNKLAIFEVSLFFFSLLGARLYHVAHFWGYYSQNPLQILNTRGGGLGLFGGLISGFFYILTFTKINRIPLIAILGPIFSILPLCQAIGRLGNFFNHEIYSPSGLPVWLYESLACLFLFFLMRLPDLSKSPISSYLIGYGFIRFFLEFLRTDTWTISGFKIAQIISIIFIIVGISIRHHQRIHQFPA